MRLRATIRSAWRCVLRMGDDDSSGMTARKTVTSVLLMLLMLAGLRGAEPAGGPDTLLAAIAEANQAHRSMQGRLTQRTRRRDEPEASARLQLVRVFVVFPDHYCVVFTKPGDDDWRLVMLSDGVTRWTEERAFKEDAPDRKATPVGADDAEQRRLIACFRFDLATLRREFAITAEPLATGARVTLAPLRPEDAGRLPTLVLEFDGAQRLTRLGIDDPQGNRLDFTVEEATYDQPIDPATFRR
jgi:outer membrane lipoprotein-sorting protein